MKKYLLLAFFVLISNLIVFLVLTYEKDPLRVVFNNAFGKDVNVQKSEITITFNKDIIQFGMNHDDQKKIAEKFFKITPSEKCSFNFISPNKLQCRLSHELDYATKYEIRILKDLKALDGSKLRKDYVSNFETERIKVKSYYRKNQEYEYTPVYTLIFNAPVKEDTLKMNFLYDNKKIGADINCIEDEVCEIWPKEILPYKKEIRVIQEKGLSAKYLNKGHEINKQLVSEEREIFKFKIENEYAEAFQIEPSAPNKIDFIVAIRKYVKSFKINYATNRKNYDVKIIKIDKEKCEKMTGMKSIYYFDCDDIEPYSYRSSYNNYNFYKISSKERLPYNAHVALKISDIKLANNYALPNKDLYSFKTDAKNFKFSLISCGGYYQDRKNKYVNNSIKKNLIMDGCDGDALGLYFNTDLKNNSQIKILYKNDKDKIKSKRINSFGYDRVFLPFLGLGKFKILKIIVKDKYNRIFNKRVNVFFKLKDLYRKCKFLFSSRPTILEKYEKSDIPILATNMKELNYNYYTYTNDGREVYKNKKHKVASSKNIKDELVPLGTRKLLNNKSGLVQGNVDGCSFRRDGLFNTQVTPFSIYYKFGLTNSLVWVTDLKTGRPVKDANVDIILDAWGNDSYDGEYNNKFGIDYKLLKTTKTNKEGVAYFPGMKTFDPNYKHHEGYWCNRNKKYLTLKVTKGDDLGILPLNCRFTEDVSTVHYRGYKKNLKYWGTTTQGIYRRGETVKFKMIVRNENDDYLTIPNEVEKFDVVLNKPTGTGGYSSYKTIKNLSLSDFGTLWGEFSLPKNAMAGEYSITLKDSKSKEEIGSVKYLTFLVADFVPASYKGKSFLDKKVYHAGEIAILDTTASLYSGGPLSYGNLYINANIYPATIHPKEKKYSSFDFKEYEFDKGYNDWEIKRYWNYEREYIKNKYYQGIDLVRKYLKLDINGNKKYKIPVKFGNNERIPYGSIYVGANLQDERGKSLYFDTSAEYIDSDRFLGSKVIKSNVDIKKNEKFHIKYLVIDDKKEAISETIKIKILKEIKKTIKEKDSYGRYQTNNYYKLEKVKEKKYKPNKILSFKFKPKDEARYYFFANVSDSRENAYTLVDEFTAERYSYSSEDDNKDTLSMKPLKEAYNVGEEAKFLIKNPYPNSYVLITKERLGVIEHFVKYLKLKDETISLPVKENDIPGVNISLTLMHKRENKEITERFASIYSISEREETDEGKPFITTASSKIFVNGDDKELKIKVGVDKREYRPSGKVEVSVNVSDTKQNGVESEISLVCLDESVFDLISEGFNYFNPILYFKGVFDGDQKNIINYNLIRLLFGNSKFKKGAVTSGDGNQQADVRKNFKFVAYWNPSIITDKEGNAKVSFKLPDNLTSFKVIAIAVDKKDKMGANSSSFKVSKDTEIRPIMPNQVRVGDKFEARFQVLNKSNEKREYEIIYSYKQGVRGNKNEYKKKVIINPFERYILSTPVDVKEKKHIYFNVYAKEINNNENQDGVVSKVKVLRIRNKETLSFSDKLVVTKEGNKREIDVKLPNGIAKGDIKITASTIVINSLEKVFEYMRDYPHPCWEQKLSRALVSAYYEEFKDYVPKSFVWKDGGKIFTKKMLKLAKNYQAPMGGMTFFEPQNGNISTYLSAFTLFGFETLKTLGYAIPKNVEDELHSYLKNLILKESDLVSRTLVVSELYKNKEVEKDEVIRLYSNKDKMDLFSKSYLLNALSFGIKNKENLTKEATQIFRDITSLGDETADTISFKDANEKHYWYDLYTNTKTNCAILSSFVNYASILKEGSEDKYYIDNNIYKLFNFVLKSRGKNGSFYNTQENIFCLKGILDYIKTYDTVNSNIEFKTILFDKEIVNFKLSKQDKKENSIKLKKEDSNKEGKLSFFAKGEGNVFYSADISYYSSLPLGETNAGISIKREYSVKKGKDFRILKEGDVLNIGDAVKVDLYINLPKESQYVAITDPLPGALEPVNSSLPGGLYMMDIDSFESLYPKESLIHKKEYRWYGFYFRELLHDNAKFYSGSLTPGDYHVSYLTEVVAKGKFKAGASYVEEMYSPDVFGRGTERSFEVK